MLGRHVYRISPADRGWSVTKDGEDQPRAAFDSREEALDQAIQFARADQPARVIVDNGEGLILEERLVGVDPGTDIGA